MSVNKRNILIAVVLIIVAAILKVATYPNSINPIVAIALFSGAIFQDKKLAFFYSQNLLQKKQFRQLIDLNMDNFTQIIFA